MVLSGLRNRLGHMSTPKMPLSIGQLQAIFYTYPRSEINNVCWLAIMICFRTLLRKSNVVPDSLMDHVLLRGDVKFYDDYLTFAVCTTETLKKGEKPLIIPIMKTNSVGFCVWSMLRWHFSVYPAGPNSPILLCPAGGGLRPLLYREVLRFIKQSVSDIGLSGAAVGLHSLRHSGAMFLQQIGVPLHEIQLLGDWRPMAVLFYLSSTYEHKHEIQRHVVSCLES